MKSSEIVTYHAWARHLGSGQLRGLPCVDEGSTAPSNGNWPVTATTSHSLQKGGRQVLTPSCQASLMASSGSSLADLTNRLLARVQAALAELTLQLASARAWRAAEARDQAIGPGHNQQRREGRDRDP